MSVIGIIQRLNKCMWRDVIFFLKCPVEVGEVMKTHG